MRQVLLLPVLVKLHSAKMKLNWMTPTWSSQHCTDGGLWHSGKARAMLRRQQLHRAFWRLLDSAVFSLSVWKLWILTYQLLVLQARQRLYCLLGDLGKRCCIHRRPHEGVGGGVQGGGERVMMGKASTHGKSLSSSVTCPPSRLVFLPTPAVAQFKVPSGTCTEKLTFYDLGFKSGSWKY